jgi:hypothetical protein
MEEINFLLPVFDEKNKVYYRFSYAMEFDDEENPDSLLEEVKNTKVYLSIYDENLHMLRESPIPLLNKKPGHHFVKDGKIWIFENIEDEMGFVRIKVDG